MFRLLLKPKRLGLTPTPVYKTNQCRSITASAIRLLDAVPPVTSIEKLILEHVKAVGPMSYATYMQFCLSHPTEGYYMKSANNIFGAQGDFITSPDISQIFGEMIAVWLLSQWEAAGSPPSIRLVELGPGRGTLITDILRVITSISKKLSQPLVVQVHLVETSLFLREIQRRRLSRAPASVQWHESIDHITPSNDSFTMLVAHEFFDALPVHVFRKTEEGWKEMMVSSRINKSEDANPEQYPRLQHVLSPETTAISNIFGNSSSRFQSLPVGSDLEVSPTSFRLARKVGELLSKRETPTSSSPGGCGLIIDYGRDHAFGSSRRGFKDHDVVDIFHRPGECDLTANVDFAYLKEAMKDLIPVYGPISQNTFLSQMGFTIRLERLLQSNQDDQAKTDRIFEGAKRLIDPVHMGEEYSVMGISTNEDKTSDEKMRDREVVTNEKMIL
ncbi:MAG: S-adenosyl-L-methionine-dependent methyltransferase [Lentinula lateritia]|uniref:Protein arginine methyltransferase NDUFAF7 n=1 Tax=Lentinula lateritia TaxID=40482 RepID=A0ABQ8W1I0_9AGAR|nr:MAG: S-adenosyl-L-methionine-dependent methyltransferase [Lentinula lateritia]KAJ4500905.1 S-adenosyl-L-methionine-dependent methyltransferase [Lentinula lateritia]